MAYLEHILSGVRRLEAIVTAVEDYTSISQLERTSVLLKEVIEQVRSELDLKASALNTRIHWSTQLSARDV